MLKNHSNIGTSGCSNLALNIWAPYAISQNSDLISSALLLLYILSPTK